MGNRKLEVRGVLFVDHTQGSQLAKKMKTEEFKLAEVTGYKVKVVEKAGTV